MPEVDVDFQNISAASDLSSKGTMACVYVNRPTLGVSDILVARVHETRTKIADLNPGVSPLYFGDVGGTMTPED